MGEKAETTTFNSIIIHQLQYVLTVKPHPKPKPLKNHALFLPLQKWLLLQKPLQSLSTQTIPIIKLPKPTTPNSSASLTTSKPTTSLSKEPKKSQSSTPPLPLPPLSPPTTQTQIYVNYALLET